MADPNVRGYQGGYSSLSPSTLPGSVPAAADADAVILPFQEGNLQTFPPSNARSKLLGPNHETKSSRPDSGNEAQGGLPRFLKVATYQPYFNVDSKEVLERSVQSILVFRADFISVTSHNPDLYGPFWICTTLIFVAAACGNYAFYLSNNTAWQFDIGKVNWGAGLFYGYTFLLPLLLYFFLKYIGVALGLVQLWCLYGYSLFVFIPVSALGLIPVGLLKWIIAAGAGFVSTTFVLLNIKAHIGSSEWSYILVMGLLVLHVCFALAFKILFFS